MTIVVARRSWREISLWKTGKGKKKEKEHMRSSQSKQPSSTAEIR